MPINSDVIIIGAGPAGLSAAIWCDDLGLDARVFESSGSPGGQLLQTYNKITNYPGVIAGNGREMLERIQHSYAERQLNLALSDAVVSVDTDAKSVTTSSGAVYQASALIIATGASRRKLGVDGEEEFFGKGILTSGKNEHEKVAGKTVCIIGGGDAAAENALILAKKAAKLFLINRKEKLSARTEFVEEIKNMANIDSLMNQIVTGFHGSNHLESVRITDKKNDTEKVLDTDFALIRIGVEPNTELLGGQIELGEKGYILVDSKCETSADGVYAIGDVANPISPTIATAVGTGATAAKTILLSLRK